MTDRLRELAEKLEHGVWLGKGSIPQPSDAYLKEQSIEAIHAALLSARDEALEEAAGIVQGANELQRMSALSSADVLWGVAQSIRSLKSKVVP